MGLFFFQFKVHISWDISREQTPVEEQGQDRECERKFTTNIFIAMKLIVLAIALPVWFLPTTHHPCPSIYLLLQSYLPALWYKKKVKRRREEGGGIKLKTMNYVRTELWDILHVISFILKPFMNFTLFWIPWPDQVRLTTGGTCQVDGRTTQSNPPGLNLTGLHWESTFFNEGHKPPGAGTD